MIRAIIFTAIGYWLSRQVYLRYDAFKRKEEQAAIRRKLQVYLESQGWNKEEIKEAMNSVIEHE